MMNKSKLLKASALTTIILSSSSAFADQLINDDLIVTNSICVGQDCSNGESFGFDTIRLKENNLRIKAQDTSTSASFPSNDWQITFNDSTNGGQNKFSIDDIDGGRTPFTIEASAPSHSLYVDDGGRVGFGTSTPVVELHVVNGDSPTLRLEQDGSSGFTPQTWDLASNETNFFIRDATNGSSLPFRIRPSAPSNSLYIDTDGDIGLGDASPDAALDVENGDLLVTNNDVGLGDPAVKFQNPTVAQAYSRLLMLDNQGGSSFFSMNINNSSAGVSQWNIQSRHEDGTFRVTNGDFNGEEFTLSKEGNLTINGDLTANGTNYASSKLLKENFESLDLKKLLVEIAKLDITKWNYIKDNDNIKHIGPYAEDFHKAFGLNGETRDSISASDISGISLAAIKALYLELERVNKELKALKGN